jgi:hypothetical protein
LSVIKKHVLRNRIFSQIVCFVVVRPVAGDMDQLGGVQASSSAGSSSSSSITFSVVFLSHLPCEPLAVLFLQHFCLPTHMFASDIL